MLDLPRSPRLRSYARLAYARRLDRKLMSLSRQGRVRVYTPFLGQEAAQVGCASAMERDDILLPTFRDSAAMVTHGVPLDDLLLFWMGYEEAHLGFGNTLPLTAPIATHLPHAVGLAHAAMLTGERRATVVMFGDGATSKGDFHEAMNLAAVLRAPVVFFCQNNQWAISTPLSAQTAQPRIADKAAAYGMPGERIDGNDHDAVERATLVALERARRGQGPTLIEALTWRRDGHSAIDDASTYRDPRDGRSWAARDPLDRMRARLEREGRWDADWAQRFDDRVDEHLATAVRRVEARAAALATDDASVFDHVYAATPPALAARRDAATARPVVAGDDFEAPLITPVAGDELHLAGAINHALGEALAADERVMLMGQDIGRLGGVFKVTDGLRHRFGAARVWDTPIAESGMVGHAIGLALGGRRPICEIQFSGFLYPAYDQLRNHAARFRSRTRGARSCPLVLRTPNGGGIAAPESHSESVEAALAAVPGLKVVVPGDPRGARGLLHAALADPDPVMFLEPTALYFALKGAVPADDPHPWAIGPPVRRRRGGDITVVTYGAGLRRALDAADRAARYGVEADVIELTTLSPLDHRPIAASVARTGRLVVHHDGTPYGDVGAELAARLHGQGVALRAFRRLCGHDVPYPYPGHEAICTPDVEQLEAALVELVGPQHRRLRVVD